MITRIKQAKQQGEQMRQMLQNAANPDAFIQSMIMNNPAMQQAMEYVSQNGGDPKAACEKLLRDNGLDINYLK